MLEAVLVEALAADAAAGRHGGGPPAQKHLEHVAVDALQAAPGGGREPVPERRQERVRGEQPHLAPQLAGAHLQELQDASAGGAHAAHDDRQQQGGQEPRRVAAQAQLLAAEVGAQRRRRRARRRRRRRHRHRRGRTLNLLVLPTSGTLSLFLSPGNRSWKVSAPSFPSLCPLPGDSFFLLISLVQVPPVNDDKEG